MKKTALAACLAAISLLAACQPAATSNQTSNSAAADKPDWDAFVAKYIDEYFAENPTFAVYQGKHEYDGRLPDWSEEGLKKQIDFLRGKREKAAAFKDADLDERQRFERDYLIGQINGDLFWRETDEQPYT